MGLASDPIWLKFLPASIRNLLEGKKGLHAAIHNSGWIFFDKILRALLGVLVGAWVARYLGPTQFGELAYCIAFIAIFQSITNLGLDGIVVREIANHPERANIVLGTTFQLRLFTGLISWLFAVVLYGLSNGFDGQGIWIVTLVGAGMVFQVADTVDLWFQANSQSKRTVLAKASAYLISNTLRIALILAEAPLIAFAIIVAIEGALTALALHASYKQFPLKAAWQKHIPEAKKLLRESWPYMISGFSIMLFMRIDQLMIKSILGEHDLGIFSAIVPISSLWNMIPVAICASLAPMFAKKRLEGLQIFNESLVKVFRLFWVICFGVVGLTWLFSAPIIHLMYGSAYKQAVPVLNIYVFTCIPVFMGVGQGLWLLNERKSYLSPIQTITGAVLSILLNLILLPLWGVTGAAVAAVISYSISSMAINIFLARNLFSMQLGIKPRGVVN